ncbi:MULTISPECIES: integrase core domain-containing protein [Kitasatospora]|uniref:integrase core domain-containing protein n=1 Tax=Kitasatospora TaxID=2063 RepID=UPI003CD0533F
MLLQRRVEPGQYSSAAFANVRGRYGIRRSTGRVGSSYDNAQAESLWRSLKREAPYKTLFSTMEQARLTILRWLTYYNARRHSTWLTCPRWSSNSGNVRQLHSHSRRKPLCPHSGGHLSP